jgi:hypothetical protein
MISGQDGPRAARGAPCRPAHRFEKNTLGVWLVAFWIGVAGLARAEGNWRLLLVQPQDSEVITRVEGQTRDLGVRVDVLARGWESGAEAQAQRLAAERGADFVARIQRGENGGLEVRVYGVKARSLRVRKVVRGRGERFGGSAEMEGAALVLRGELSALMRGEAETGAGGVAAGSGGVAGGQGVVDTHAHVDEHAHAHVDEHAYESENEHEHVDEHVDEREEQNEHEREEQNEREAEEESEEPVENFSARRAAWTVRAGGRASLPIDGKGAFGALVGGRAQFEWLEVGLSFSGSAPIELEDPNVRVRLSRYALTAEALGVIPWGPRLRVLFGVTSGVVMYARKTDSLSEVYAANGGESAWSPTLGAQAELQWVFARQWGMGLAAGLDVIPLRTRFTYPSVNPGQNTEIAALRGLEPWGTLCLFGLFGD